MSAIQQYLASINQQQAINQTTGTGNSGLTLQLGLVTFQAMEIPEMFGKIGGTQALAVHEFPGGVKTIQALGAFPLPVQWEGWLIGASAITRSQQLDRFRVNGEILNLQYGAFSWSGYIREYSAVARHQNMIRYSIAFEPQKDNSGAAAVPNAPVSPNTTFGNSVTGLTGTASGANGLTLPSAMQTPVTSTISDANTALGQSNGSVSAFTPQQTAQIGVDAVAVNASAAPFIAGTDATQASPALAAANQATVAAITAAQANPPLSTVYVTNPNLFALATEYYGDATQWQVIGNANGLTDPLPTGQFTLTVPPLPTGSLPSPVPQTP